MCPDKPIKFCPYCGTPTILRMAFGKERPSCPACGFVHYEDPKVAAAALIQDGNQILLTRRIYDPHRGDWTLPAGFVDAHEDPIDAVVRECLEETGLTVEVVELFDIITGREHPHGADIVLVYKVRVLHGTLRAGDDADEVGFFDCQNLPPLAFRATLQTLQKNELLPIGWETCL